LRKFRCLFLRILRKTNFAWNLGAGAAWKITDSVSMDLGYLRYADLGKLSGIGGISTDNPIDIEIPAKVKVTSHDVLLGLRFAFNCSVPALWKNY